MRCCRKTDADAPQSYLSHSTSWRFEPPNTVVLSYIVCLPSRWHICQEGLQKLLPVSVEQSAWQDMFLNDLQLTHSAAPHAPSPNRIEAHHVLSHALRHLAFLAHGPTADVTVSRYLEPQTKRFLSSVMPALAGQLHLGRECV